ncbi:MAG: AI-2E family transporter [Candidatus Electryonea clarkiae]|nr:AI-2E family transporter [Candidatus Electryonea clarkiae]MDP8288261.1 AI-2E family transporter [Candidatus Electryonea clarkiae]
MSQKPSANDLPTENKSTGNSPDRRFLRTYLVLILFITLGLFLYMTRMFALPVVLAAIFAGLFYPLYSWFTIRFKGRKAAASGVTCLILIAGILIPLTLIGNMVAQEAISFYNDSEKLVTNFIEGSNGGLREKIEKVIPKKYIDSAKIDWKKALTNVARTTGKVIADVIGDTSKSAFQALMNLFIILFTMFYLFQDGPALLKRFKYLSPLDDIHEERIIDRFLSVSRATIKGTLLLGLIQGTMGGIVLLAFGVKSALLWTVVMVIASIVPMLGPSIVLIPVGIVFLVSGDIWQGILIILIQLVIISNVDNLLRPRLVGKDAQMHDLMIFFSTIGGIAVFGIAGFIIGPVLAALLLTILDIYGLEFKGFLQTGSDAKEST